MPSSFPFLKSINKKKICKKTLEQNLDQHRKQPVAPAASLLLATGPIFRN